MAILLLGFDHLPNNSLHKQQPAPLWKLVEATQPMSQGFPCNLSLSTAIPELTPSPSDICLLTMLAISIPKDMLTSLYTCEEPRVS